MLFPSRDGIVIPCFYVRKQVEIDVGSSTVARGVVSLVLGYLNNLVIEMAFVIQVIPYPNSFKTFYTLLEVLSYNLVKCFQLLLVWQGNTQEELPEILLGTCRLNHLDVDKSVLVEP